MDRPPPTPSTNKYGLFGESELPIGIYEYRTRNMMELSTIRTEI
jgi:hypothetical protein